MTKTERELITRLVEYVEQSMWSMEQTCKQLQHELSKIQEILDNVQQ